MKIYIDSDYKCYTTNPDNTYRAFDVQFFDLKCPEFIEGHRYIPNGETWIDLNGVENDGEAAFPWKPWSELDAAQYEYERRLIPEYDRAFHELERLIKPERVGGTMDTFAQVRKQAILARINELLSGGG